MAIPAALDAVVTSLCVHGDDGDPEAASKRHLRTPAEHASYHNHVRYMIPLEQQLDYLRSAGFQGVDVYWKRLEYVVYAGCRPR